MGWFGSIQNGFCWLFLVGHGNAAGGYGMATRVPGSRRAAKVVLQ